MLVTRPLFFPLLSRAARHTRLFLPSDRCHRERFVPSIQSRAFYSSFLPFLFFFFAAISGKTTLNREESGSCGFSRSSFYQFLGEMDPSTLRVNTYARVHPRSVKKQLAWIDRKKQRPERRLHSPRFKVGRGKGRTQRTSRTNTRR